MPPVTEIHRIKCPYCPLGHAMVKVLVGPGTAVTVHLRDNPRCETCKRFFKLRSRLKLYGEAIEEERHKSGGSMKIEIPIGDYKRRS